MSTELSHHRVHSELRQGRGSTDIVIKACILAFPSIWVSCNIALQVTSCRKKIATKYHVSPLLHICDVKL
jgi:hypothetical protein